MRCAPSRFGVPQCGARHVVLAGNDGRAGGAACRTIRFGDGTGRIAVICPDNLIAPVRDAVRRKLAVILDPAEYARLIEQPEWDEQISVCGTETVKGLEFDAVVVVEPGLIEDDAPSRLVAASDLYVAMTRPTQKLVIVRTKADEKSLNI